MSDAPSPRTWRPEERLLLRSLHGTTRDTAPDPQALARAVTDWPYLLRIARAHGVLPALHTLSQTHDLPIPHEIGGYLSDHAAVCADHARVLEEEVGRVGEALGARNIPALLLRGPRTDQNQPPVAPPVPHILVRASDAWAARACLAELQYHSALPETLGAHDWCRGRELRYQSTVRFADGGHPALMLLWSPVPLNLPAPRAWESLAADAVPAFRSGTSLRAPVGTSRLLLLSLLGAFETWERLSSLVSFAACATAATNHDWARALAAANTSAMTRRLRVAAQLARDLLGVHLPAFAVAGVVDDRHTAALARELTHRLFDVSIDPRAAILRHRLLLRSLDTRRDRWRYALGILGTQTPSLYRAVRASLPTQGPSPLTRTDAPIPATTIGRMLDAGGVTARDTIYDLGCGDGRILIGAARRGARAVGIELDRTTLAAARTAVAAAGVAELVTLVHGDCRNADLSAATVVTMNLGWHLTMELGPRLRTTLPPGTRLLSLNAEIGSWVPEQRLTLTDPAGETDQLYIWRVPGEPGEPTGAERPSRRGGAGPTR